VQRQSEGGGASHPPALEHYLRLVGRSPDYSSSLHCNVCHRLHTEDGKNHGRYASRLAVVVPLPAHGQGLRTDAGSAAVYKRTLQRILASLKRWGKSASNMSERRTLREDRILAESDYDRTIRTQEAERDVGPGGRTGG
jgi:hypothetical protein